MSKNKKKKNCDTREFTALKSCDSKKAQNCEKKQPEQMRITDRAQRPSFEV